MKATIVSLAFVVVMFTLCRTAYSQENENSGAWLFHSCQAHLRVIDSPEGVGQSSDLAPARRCVDYMDGLTNAAFLSQKICMKAGTGADALVRTYVAHMKKNPELMDVAKGFGAFQALTNSYPCPYTEHSN
jgi:hypothetical protein